MAQIAGRAGRHMANGTFGATNGCEPFEPREIEAIEGHAFPPLKSLRWRNSELDFADVEALSASLDQAPHLDCLVKVRDAIDHRSLIFLSRRDEIRHAASSEERVRLLWQVCQIPDFRKTLTDAHLHLLATVYKHLTGKKGVLPNDWVGNMIAQLERFDGDIDALVSRIAHVRTWTYMSHRASWLIDAAHWQERAREVEDRLSDALHERLTQRFVDRRTSALMRSLRDRDDHAAVVDAGGEIAVDGHVVGRIEGLNLTIVDAGLEADRRLLTAAARRTALPVLRRRAGELVAAEDAALALAEDDTLRWREAIVARLRPGPAVLAPRLQLELDPTLDAVLHDRVRGRLGRWLQGWIGARLGALERLRAAAAGDALTGAGRGIAYRLVELQGAMRRAEADSLIHDLVHADRRALARLGVRFGRHHVYRSRSAQARRERGAHAADAHLPRSTAAAAAARADRAALALSGAGRRHAVGGVRGVRRVRGPGRHARTDRGTGPRQGAGQRVVQRAADHGRRGGPDPARARRAGGGPGLPSRDGGGGRDRLQPPGIAAARRHRPAPCRQCRAGPLAVRGAGGPPAGPARMSDALRLDKWLFQARFIHNRRLAEALVAARRVRLNEKIVGKTHQLVRPGDVITLTDQREVRVLRVRALGERRGPAVEARGLYEELARVV